MTAEEIEQARQIWERRAATLAATLTPLLNQYALQPLTCHWKGSVVLLSDAESERNKAVYSVDDKTIFLSIKYLSDVSLWRTLLHELIHTHSAHCVGGSFHEYIIAPGWEEAPVEYLQRALRGRVFSRVGAELSEGSEAAFQAGDADWDSVYGSALIAWGTLHSGFQSLNAASREPITFACELLARPIRERASYLLEQCMPPTSLQKKQALLAFSAARRDIESPRGAIVPSLPEVR